MVTKSQAPDRGSNCIKSSRAWSTYCCSIEVDRCKELQLGPWKIVFLLNYLPRGVWSLQATNSLRWCSFSRLDTVGAWGLCCLTWCGLWPLATSQRGDWSNCRLHKEIQIFPFRTISMYTFFSPAGSVWHRSYLKRDFLISFSSSQKDKCAHLSCSFWVGVRLVAFTNLLIDITQ